RALLADARLAARRPRAPLPDAGRHPRRRPLPEPLRTRRLEDAEALLDVRLPDRDLAPALVGRDAARRRGQVRADLVEAHLPRLDARPLLARRRLAVGPARRHEALGVPGRVDPVRNSGIAVRDHEADHTVGVDLALASVQAPDLVRVLDRLAPEVAELEADVLRRPADAVLDDERLVRAE